MEINAIHKEFHNALHQYISKRVRNEADAEDLLQEVFIRIHHGASSVAKKESVRSWIYTVTRNTIIDYYRKNSKKPRPVGMDGGEEYFSEQEPEPSPGLERCIHRFIDRLPEEYRQIIIDSELKGIRQKDLAEKYHLQYPSLRSRVQRGRARLREMFLDCCKIELDPRGNVMDATPRKGKC